MLQRHRMAGQRAAATGQRSQTLSECCVEALDIGRIDHTGSLRATPQRLDAHGCALDDPALDIDHPPLGVALHDLGNAEIAPGTQPGRPGPPVCTGSRKVSRIARM